jgi:hypothetical protein
MARFQKGTTDHDSDGRMGGSLKGDVTMTKAPTPKAKASTKPTPADRAAVDAQFKEADAKGAPSEDDIAHATARRAVTGF